MKRKIVNTSTKEIDLLTKDDFHSIRGGKSTNEIPSTASTKDEPWVKIGVSINF